MLTVNLHRATNPTVSEVTRDVFPPGFITPFFSLGAAPRLTEPSCIGAGVVDYALVDEGKLAGGGRGGRGGGTSMTGCQGCRGGGISWTGSRITVAPGSFKVVSVSVGGGGAPWLLEPSSQGALVVGPTLQNMAI